MAEDEAGDAQGEGERESEEAKEASKESAPEKRAWYYCVRDGEGKSGGAKGPLQSWALLKLLEQGVIAAEKTLVSSGGEWVWLSESMLKEQVALVRHRWYYAGEGGEREGPVNVGELRRRFEAGDIDGLTQVYWEDAWRAIAQIPALREVLAPSGAASFESLDKNPRPADEGAAATETSSFVADDGRAFGFDAASGTWREVDAAEATAAEEARAAEGVVRGGCDDDDDRRDDDDGDDGRDRRRENPTKKRKRGPKKKGWDPESAKCWVYVEGLPSDTTVEEIRSHFSKCGAIATDPETIGPRIKLYKDATTGLLKGDCSVCYAHPASVEPALQVLDGSRLRYGLDPIRVARATFGADRLGEYDAAKGKSVDPNKRKVAKQMAQQRLEWTADADAPDLDDTGRNKKKKTARIVVVPDAFDLNVEGDADASEARILAKLKDAGLHEPPLKLTVFSKHPDAPALLKLASPADAQLALDAFPKAHFWDRVTNYAAVARPDLEAAERADEQRRLQDFGDWLDDQDLPPELQPRVEA